MFVDQHNVSRSTAELDTPIGAFSGLWLHATLLGFVNQALYLFWFWTICPTNQGISITKLLTFNKPNANKVKENY